MKKQLFSLLLLISFVFSISAQKAEKADVVDQNLRKNIAYLAGDQLEGRRTGEAGATMAAGYVANQFANLKLKPGVAGTAKSNKSTSGYMQSFPYFSGVELGADNVLKLDLPQVGITVNLRSNWMPAGASSSGTIAKTGIIFAGYGIVSEEAKYDDYAGLDAAGKIVLVFSGTPDSGSPHSPFVKFEDVRVKAKIAHDKGAKGLIVIAAEVKLEEDRLAKLSFDQTLGDTAVPTAVVARSIGALLLGDKSDQELKRDESFIAMRKDAAALMQVNLTGRPQATGEMKVDLVKKPAEASNVIGILPGVDPQLKNEAIIVGAHYDHLGHGGTSSLAPNSTEIHHGADDNASGVSAMLEIARQAVARKNNKRTLIFMAFSGEEEGLIGSKFYVNNPVFPIENTVAMINLDMVGRLKDDKLSVGGMGTASEWNELVKRRNEIYFDNDNGYGVGKKFNLQLNDDGYGPSDHSSFYGKKIPVLFLFTGSHEDYHKPSDTADKINYEGVTSIVYFVSDLLKNIDQTAQKPTYTVAKTTPMGGRSGFNISLGTVPSYAESSDGMVIDGVRDNSPAARAGLKPNDKIVKLAGKEIRNVMDYTYILGEMKAGQEYEVEVMRGAERLTMKITPVKRN
jgi:aminopeptidase YwaD